MIDEGVNVDDHFRDLTKMVGLGSGSQRPIPDFMLTLCAGKGGLDGLLQLDIFNILCLRCPLCFFIKSIISKRQAGKANQIPDLGMWFGVAPANHQENHIWWIYEQQKHIKKHKKEVLAHDFKRER